MQKESDVSLQGRVLGLLTSVSAFGVPAGMLVFGPLADVVDVRLLFVVGGLMTVPIGAYVMRSARTAGGYSYKRACLLPHSA